MSSVPTDTPVTVSVYMKVKTCSEPVPETPNVSTKLVLRVLGVVKHLRVAN
ncbi:hypothetical protein Hanom_Chr04g00310361 [Helianthus anomalus]